MPYDQDLEVTRPLYYSTYLIDKDITVEFTPGKKVGEYRFGFPAKSASKSILFNVYNDGPAKWNFSGGNEINGMETYHGDIKVYVYGDFNAKGTAGVLFFVSFVFFFFFVGFGVFFVGLVVLFVVWFLLFCFCWLFFLLFFFVLPTCLV